MKRSTFDALLSFLSGISWAFVIIGAWVTFQSFIAFGTIPAVLFTFIFIFLALFLILLLETIGLAKERQAERQKQTQLLEEIRDTLKIFSPRIDE